MDEKDPPPDDHERMLTLLDHMSRTVNVMNKIIIYMRKNVEQQAEQRQYEEPAEVSPDRVIH